MTKRSPAEDKRRAELVPSALATKLERDAVDDKTLERASSLRAKAARFNRARTVTDESWIEHRNALGVERDMARAMVIICAATGYQPLENQDALHQAAPAPGEDRINKFYCGGIGTGKSTAGMVDAVKVALMNPGALGLVVAPTYDQCLHVLLPTFLRLCEQMEAAGFPILKRFRWARMHAELICGGEVFFRSVSKIDNLLGFAFAWIHFDESETVTNSELIWTTLSGRLRQKAHFRQFVATSTPRGLRGVVAIFQTAREDYKTQEECARLRQRFFFVRSTTLDNPHLPQDYIDNLRRTLSRQAWDQEVMAKILRPEAAVYSEFERARHEMHWPDGRATFIARLRQLGVEYDVTYDPGQTYAHVLWIARFATGDVVFDELCDDAITSDRLHAEVVLRCAKLGRAPAMFVVDRAVKWERAWIMENFPQSTLAYMDSKREQSIDEGIKIVKNLLDPMEGEPKLKFCSFMWDRPARRAIIRCMTNYQYGRMASGVLTPMPRRDNVHDHGVDALRMWCMKRHGDNYRYLVVQRRLAA